MAGRREPAPGRPRRCAHPHPRLPRQLYERSASGVRVPGAAEGVAARRRPRAGAPGVEALRPPRLAGLRAGRLRPRTGSGWAARRAARPRRSRRTGKLKLGPGGYHDIEFRVQLLRRPRPHRRRRARRGRPCPRLRSLTEHGYVGGVEAAGRRGLPVLGSSSTGCSCAASSAPTCCRPTRPSCASSRVDRLAADGPALSERIARVRARVRGLHQRLFYRPLLTAVSNLPEDELMLSPAAALDRLASIGFLDARGALQHIAALTAGVSRRASIQRTLLPVLLQWFSEGPAPDLGPAGVPPAVGAARRHRLVPADAAGLADRRAAPRDRAVRVPVRDRAARDVPGGGRLARARRRPPPPHPGDAPRGDLRDRAPAPLPGRGRGVAADRAAPEVLRLALGALLGTITVQALGPALADITTALLAGCVRSVRRDEGPWPEFAIIAMGRYGGAEQGFGSDADVMAVYRAIAGMPDDVAQRQAGVLVSEIKRLTDRPAPPARPRLRPAAGGAQRPGRPVAAVLRGLLRTLVADVGVAGAAPRARRRRRPHARDRLPGARGPPPLPGGARRRARCARSAGSRRAWRRSACRAPSTRRGT